MAGRAAQPRSLPPLREDRDGALPADDPYLRGGRQSSRVMIAFGSVSACLSWDHVADDALGDVAGHAGSARLIRERAMLRRSCNVST
jgi:hypothetical protein